MVGMAIVPSSWAAGPGQSIEQLYDQVRQDPQRLRIFLSAFPKGGDLHNQLDGSVYAETVLHWAAKDNLCVSLNMGRILSSPCGVSTHNEQPAPLLSKDLTSWSHLVSALSLKDFVPTVGDRSAHDHFFGAFERFAVVEKSHRGELLAEALKEAARNHVSYIEFVLAPLASSTVSVDGKLKLSQVSDLSHVHQELLKSLPDLLKQVRQEVADMENQARGILLCGERNEDPACQIEVRYLFQALRNAAPIVVFTELEMGYLLAQSNPLFVGVTLTGPEDSPVALSEYELQMEMFRFLNNLYKNIKLALPAGELTPTLVSPENLSFHMQSALKVAGAKRIVQGLDAVYEDDIAGLLQTMARHSVALELNLTRNEILTKVKGRQHPLMLFYHAGVPIILTSDSGGILRADLTDQYILAVSRYQPSYADLVRLSRNSLELSFIEGQSLWVSGHLGQRVKICASEPVSAQPTKSCATYLRQNAKAELEWRLEVSLKEFSSDMLQNRVLVY